jgi:hypothetical protein
MTLLIIADEKNKIFQKELITQIREKKSWENLAAFN